MNVSIVIPTLNEQAYIDTCLDTVHRNLDRAADSIDTEVLIVDSHSTDNTRSLVRAHPIDCRIVSAEDGVLTARHVGINTADGEIIVSLDADSVYSDQFLMSLLRPFRERENVSLTYGPCYGEQPLHIDASLRLGLQFGAPLLGLYWVSGANRAFKKSAYQATGGYDLSTDARSVFHVMAEEQVSVPLQLANEGEIVFVNEAAAVQSSRTLKQLFLVSEKNGGQSWSLLKHYGLLTRVKKLGKRIANR